MSAQLKCPACGTPLTVFDDAPKFVTCPRCLAIIESPMSTGQGPPLLPAISLDQEAGNDTRIARGIIAVVTILVLIGVSVQFMETKSSDAEGVAYLAVLGLAVVMFILAGLMGKPTNPREAESFGADLGSDQTDRSPIELEYNSIRHQDRAVQARAAPFAAGFFISLAVCAGGFFLLGANVTTTGHVHGGNVIYLLIVVGTVVATICMGVVVGRKPRMRGFNQGMAVGMVLGMLALGPCAFCYLMMLN